jgi:hypothetical protein
VARCVVILYLCLFVSWVCITPVSVQAYKRHSDDTTQAAEYAQQPAVHALSGK